MSKNKDDSGQQSDPLQQALGEIRHLKLTISALRDEMEIIEATAQERVQRALADSSGEITQLRETISAQRDQLEEVQFQIEI